MSEIGRKLLGFGGVIILLKTVSFIVMKEKLLLFAFSFPLLL